MAKATAFVFTEPFGALTDVHAFTDEQSAFQRAEWYAAHDTKAVAFVGAFSVDEIQSTLRRLRREYVAQLAARLNTQQVSA